MILRIFGLVCGVLLWRHAEERRSAPISLTRGQPTVMQIRYQNKNFGQNPIFVIVSCNDRDDTGDFNARKNFTEVIWGKRDGSFIAFTHSAAACSTVAALSFFGDELHTFMIYLF